MAKARKNDGVTVKVFVANKRIAELLCAGFEGGCGYWCRIMDCVPPARPVAVLDPEGDVYMYTDFPLTGGKVIVRLDDGSSGDTDEKYEPLVLNGAAIKKGLQLMPEKAPHHWANFLNENEDALTGDVFIQLCLLGEIVYG